MQIKILPADLVSVKARRKKRLSSSTIEVTIPSTIVRRYDLKDQDQIMICYVCRADEDLKEINQQ